jgi:sensor c-di-GMP phosphodiesterase-like protein
MKAGRGFSREISRELSRAIRNHEFVIHYLPTMDNHSGNCIGAEALIRWNHPRQGLVMPDIFIPIAERTGMIVPMTQWLIERLAEEMGEWLKANPECYLSINITPRTSNRPSFSSGLSDPAPPRHCPQPADPGDHRTGADRWRQQHHPQGAAMANQYGFKLAIDDFGTGYNNIGPSV